MLHMRVKVHSPTPTPGRRSQGRLIESVGTMRTSICCHRERPAAARYRKSRVEFNGLTANDR